MNTQRPTCMDNLDFRLHNMLNIVAKILFKSSAFVFHGIKKVIQVWN